MGNHRKCFNHTSSKLHGHHSFEQYGWATASSAIFGSWLSRGAGTSISIGGNRLAVQAFAATVTFLQQTACGHVHHPASELTQKSKCTDLRQRAAARLFFFQDLPNLDMC